MPVTCPHCSTRYVLPKALLGPGGARVRCPRCREPFAVSPEGEALAPSPKPGESVAVSPAATSFPSASAAPGVVPAPTNGVAESVKRIPAAHSPYAPPGLVDAGEKPVEPAHTTPHAEPSHAGPPLLEVKLPEKGAAPPAAAPAAAPPASAAAPTTDESAPAVIETPIVVARTVLDELSQHSGGAIAASREAGKLFREFGPVIAEAFEFYRRRVGPGADAAPFRAALREKWGVDLDPGHPTGRIG